MGFSYAAPFYRRKSDRELAFAFVSYKCRYRKPNCSPIARVCLNGPIRQAAVSISSGVPFGRGVREILNTGNGRRREIPEVLHRPKFGAVNLSRSIKYKTYIVKTSPAASLSSRYIFAFAKVGDLTKGKYPFLQNPPPPPQRPNYQSARTSRAPQK